MLLMASVSSIVKEIISGNKLLQEAMAQQIMSYGATAERIKERVEEAYGKKVKESAIVMALRRQAEQTTKKEDRQIKIKSEIIMKTGLAYISFQRTGDFLEKMEKFHKRIEPEKDTFNIIQGNHEISVITNQKNTPKVKELLGRQPLTEENNLVALSISLGKDFAYTPGVIYTITRKLYWESVNIFEVITTATELTLLLLEKDAVKAYTAINELMKN